MIVKHVSRDSFFFFFFFSSSDVPCLNQILEWYLVLNISHIRTWMMMTAIAWYMMHRVGSKRSHNTVDESFWLSYVPLCVFFVWIVPIYQCENPVLWSQQQQQKQHEGFCAFLCHKMLCFIMLVVPWGFVSPGRGSSGRGFVYTCDGPTYITGSFWSIDASKGKTKSASSCRVLTAHYV